MKRIALIALAGLALVAAALAAHHVLFREVEEVPVWVIASYSGEVEVSHAGGAWQPAAIREPLADSDRIRTGESGEAMLIHDSSHVTVRASTELTVSSLTAESNDFDLVGMVFVEARGDRIVLSDPVTEAAVEADEAGYGLTIRPDGYVSVAVKRGGADFTAMGTTRRVEEGHESHAAAGRPPSTPTPIPKSILLNVSFPDAATFNTRIARIEGRADPGSRVLVAGRSVQTGSDGRFEAEVELEEGPNRIAVAAMDVLGRQRTVRSGAIEVDTAAPTLDGVRVGGREVTR